LTIIPVVNGVSTFEGIFDTIMAGQPTSEVVPALRVLSAIDRQALLCTICAIHDEIERNSHEHGRDVRQLLEAECSLFVNGVATCFVDQHDWNPYAPGELET
jgi:hypothetical protein